MGTVIRLMASVTGMVASVMKLMAADLAYLFVVLFQQSGGQVCRSTQFILKEKSADSSEQLETHFPTFLYVLQSQ